MFFREKAVEISFDKKNQEIFQVKCLLISHFPSLKGVLKNLNCKFKKNHYYDENFISEGKYTKFSLSIRSIRKTLRMLLSRTRVEILD